MKREPESNGERSGFLVIVSFVEAEPLRVSSGWPRPTYRDALDRFGHELVVILIGAVNREPDGHARAIGEQAAFRSALGAIGWVGAGFFPRPAAPSSSRRPSRATSSRCPWSRRRPRVLGARIRGTPRRRAIRESAYRRRRTSRSPLHRGHSIDSPYEAQRRSRPLHRDRERAGCGSREGVPAEAVGALPSSPTTSREVSSDLCSRSRSWTSTSRPNRASRNFLTRSSSKPTLRSRPTEIGSKQSAMPSIVA